MHSCDVVYKRQRRRRRRGCSSESTLLSELLLLLLLSYYPQYNNHYQQHSLLLSIIIMISKLILLLLQQQPLLLLLLLITIIIQHSATNIVVVSSFNFHTSYFDINSSSASSRLKNTLLWIPYNNNNNMAIIQSISSCNSNNNNRIRQQQQRNRQCSSTTTSTTTTTSLSSVSQLLTWRIYGVEVHPDRFVDNHHTTTTGSSSNTNTNTNIDTKNKKNDITTTNNNNNNTTTVKTTTTTTTTTTEVIHPAIMEALCKRLNLPIPTTTTKITSSSSSDTSTATKNNNTTTILQSVTIIRRSLDARDYKQRVDKLFGPRYIYVIDIVVDTKLMKRYKIRPFKHIPGRIEQIIIQQSSTTNNNNNNNHKNKNNDNHDDDILSTTTMNDNLQQQQQKPSLSKIPINTQISTIINTNKKKPIVIIVGAGPAGLFCAIQLAQSGIVTPIVVERGQPVEIRGKDIGAFIHRRNLNIDSNFAFGEGGAGTWSDGKLTTRIGRNSYMVRYVLQTFVQYGAPDTILIDGAPHLGTDNLVRLLRNMRQHLRSMGAIIQFGTKVTELIIDNNVTIGVKYTINNRNIIERENVDSYDSNNEYFNMDDNNNSSSNNGTIIGNAVVIATGHSARDMYEQLHTMGVQLEAKGFAVGFRIEHPQKIINHIQYGQEWGTSVITGKGTTDIANMKYFQSKINNIENKNNNDILSLEPQHKGILPVPSYRLATDKAYDGNNTRGVYSFCMCPGGQIVPASTDPNEVCVNGMSFSRRDSLFANSALVVTVDPNDTILDPYRVKHGVLAGIAFQRDMEQRAAIMGGGNFVVPVQKVTDFISDRESTTVPPSSYRLGVKPAACHLIYPQPLVTSLKAALVDYFDRQMPGFVCDEGLLHGVETRTSSPVRVVRHHISYEAIGIQNLYPAGEGAGFAGGIVSAAVDGMSVAQAILTQKFNVDVSSDYRYDENTRVETSY